MKIRRSYLYLADLSPRFGSEPGKIRPIVVLQSDKLNDAGHPSTWILPCTTKTVGTNVLRVSLPKGLARNREDCEVMIDQSRAIDNRRFVKELGRLPDIIMREVEAKLRLCAAL